MRMKNIQMEKNAAFAGSSGERRHSRLHQLSVADDRMRSDVDAGTVRILLGRITTIQSR